MHSEEPIDPLEPIRSGAIEEELAAWNREDQAAALEISQIQERLAAHAARVVGLEKSWSELAERASEQSAKSAELEREVVRLREAADAAHAARRSTSADLRRAERRAAAAESEGDEAARRADEAAKRIAALEEELAAVRADLQAQTAAADSAAAQRDEARAELAKISNDLERISRELGQALVDRDAEAAAAGEASRALEEAGREMENLRGELGREAKARSSAEASLAEARDGLARAEETVAAQLTEKRALVADLVGTQATLQVRSEQLRRTFESRWYRLARSAWRVRRRRPPLGAVALLLLAFAAPVAALLSGGDAAAVAAGVLAFAVLALCAAAYAVLVPALRDRTPPRLAGDGTFARPLDVPDASMPDPQAAVAEAASARPQAQAPDAEAVRLVPRATAGAAVDAERRAWLGGDSVADLGRLRVAGILDDMSAASFGPECDLFTEFHAVDWRERLEEHPPHLLLVESAWSGNRGGWQYCVGSYDHPRYAGLAALRQLIAWARENGIPSVFWNKEDPVHFDRFKEAAALFDHVLTTDANRVEAYRAQAGPDCRSVGTLQFAAQPRLHNPVPVTDVRLREPVFAGTYYRGRHPARRKSLEALLDAARPHGLVIYDRTLGSTSEEYGFPERFRPNVKGRLSYAETVDVYKRHQVFLNVNSVTDSPTMFSRRVFELLACGTAVLSTPSVGMQETFGDLVPVAETQEEAEAELGRLLKDEGYRQDLVRRGQMLVLGAHTYRDRLAQIAATAGFDVGAAAGEGVAALVVAEEGDVLVRRVEALRAQSRAFDEILVGVPSDGSLDEEASGLESRVPGAIRVVRQDPGEARSGRIAKLAALSSSPWVLPLADGADPAPSLVESLLVCTRFADADVVGCAREEHAASSYGAEVLLNASLARRETVARRGWPGTGDEMRRWARQGVRFYAADPRFRA